MDILAFYVLMSACLPLLIHSILIPNNYFSFSAIVHRQWSFVLPCHAVPCAKCLSNCFRPCFCGTRTSFRKQFHGHFVGVLAWPIVFWSGQMLPDKCLPGVWELAAKRCRRFGALGRERFTTHLVVVGRGKDNYKVGNSFT